MDEILKKKEQTRRSEASIFFDLQLKRPTAKDYADFNFTALCDEKEKPDRLEEETCSSTSSDASSCSDDYNEKGQVREYIASDLMAKGIGYDVNDAFIDDSEVHIPPPKAVSEKQMLYGGYYINCGPIKLKEDPPSENDDVSDEDIEVPKKKTTKATPKKAKTKADKTEKAPPSSPIKARMTGLPPSLRMVGKPPTKKSVSQTSVSEEARTNTAVSKKSGESSAKDEVAQVKLPKKRKLAEQNEEGVKKARKPREKKNNVDQLSVAELLNKPEEVKEENRMELSETQVEPVEQVQSTTADKSISDNISTPTSSTTQPITKPFKPRKPRVDKKSTEVQKQPTVPVMTPEFVRENIRRTDDGKFIFMGQTDITKFMEHFFSTRTNPSTSGDSKSAKPEPTIQQMLQTLLSTQNKNSTSLPSSAVKNQTPKVNSQQSSSTQNGNSTSVKNQKPKSNVEQASSSLIQNDIPPVSLPNQISVKKIKPRKKNVQKIPAASSTQNVNPAPIPSSSRVIITTQTPANKPNVNINPALNHLIRYANQPNRPSFTMPTSTTQPINKNPPYKPVHPIQQQSKTPTPSTIGPKQYVPRNLPYKPVHPVQPIRLITPQMPSQTQSNSIPTSNDLLRPPVHLNTTPQQSTSNMPQQLTVRQMIEQVRQTHGSLPHLMFQSVLAQQMSNLTANKRTQ